MHRPSTFRRRSILGHHRDPARHRRTPRGRARTHPVRHLRRPDQLELVDFYHHHANWSNGMILGTLSTLWLASQSAKGCGPSPDDLHRSSLWHQVWQQLAGLCAPTRRKRRQIEDATREVEQIRAFRDTWEYGIHSYLTYLRDRLTVSRDPAHRFRQRLCSDRRRKRSSCPLSP